MLQDIVKQPKHKMKQLYYQQTTNSITIKDTRKIYKITTDNIIRIQSEAGVSTIIRKGGNAISLSKNLVFFEKQLYDFGFIRINRNDLINSNEIEFIDCKKREVIMKDGTQLTISVRNLSKICKN